MTAAAPKLSEVLNDAVRARIAPKIAVLDTPNDVPSSNAFYKVMFDPNLDPDAKKAAVIKLLVFPGSKEESRAAIKEYNAFESYMQSVREKMATRIIELQDTDTFSILQDVINNLNNQLLDFEKQMQPLTDITDAIYTLRSNDKTLDVYREIQNDKDREEKEKALKAEQEKKLAEATDKIRALMHKNSDLSEEKSFFGFGGITKEARQSIARNELELQESKASLDRLTIEAAALDAKSENAPGEFANEKAKLRELLDLTSSEHKDRQEKLVKCALDFITSAKRDIGEVRTHLEKMNGTVETLLDNNTKMTGVYGILQEGIEDAQKVNLEQQKVLAVIPEGERSISKITREENKMVMDDHIRLLDNAIRNTTEASTDLTTQTIRVKGMKDANEATLETTRKLHTQGVAGIADRLSSTLQAVSNAALGESSTAAKDTLRHMDEITNKISQRESIRVAMGVKEINNDLKLALDNLGSYGEVQRAANSITRDGISEIRDNLAKIKAAASATQKDLHDSFALASENTRPVDDGAAPVTKKPAFDNPFGG
jgi:hypothetical protein